jgi:hypothetical protein
MGGYFQSTPFEEKVMQAKGPITFYDSVTGKPLFVAPINRSREEFIEESKIHGWPSFRDDEVSAAADLFVGSFPRISAVSSHVASVVIYS